MPAFILNSSPAIWMEVPLPDEANASLPGFFLAYSTSSCTDFTGTCGFTTRMLGTLAPQRHRCEVLGQVESRRSCTASG